MKNSPEQESIDSTGESSTGYSLGMNPDKYWYPGTELNGEYSSEALDKSIEAIYQASGLSSPLIIHCQSIFQLTLYPVLFALLIDDLAREAVLPELRASLHSERWMALWLHLDQSVIPRGIVDQFRLRQNSPSHQSFQLKKLNQQIHAIYQELGGTVDTHETPRLTSIGLQTNSYMRANFKKLLYELEQQIRKSALLEGNANHERTDLESQWQTVESQLDLQIMPGILAEAAVEINANLNRLLNNCQSGASFPSTAPRGLSSIVDSPNSLSEVLRLLCQSSAKQEQSSVWSRNQPLDTASGARMGAYSDPTIRLIASSLQLELYKRSQFMSQLPLLKREVEFHSARIATEQIKLLDHWCRVLNQGYAAIFYQDLFLICQRPSHSSLDSENRFHDEAGPALAFADGYRYWAWHGRTVTEDIIENPSTISIERIENEKNLEIRAILIERYGISEFLRDSGAEKIHEDEFGILYKKWFRTKNSIFDEPFVVVRVHNATAEPDGFHKQYFLRVPPNVMTAREAVAWTFGMSTEEYDPERET